MAERKLVSTVEWPTCRLTEALFDCFLRELVPSGLRTLALDSWADRFEELKPLERDHLVELLEALRAMSPVMTDVRAAKRQHLFFSSFLVACEALSSSGDDCDGLFADSAAWSMACRRLLTFLVPADAMRAAFQVVIDRETARPPLV